MTDAKVYIVSLGTVSAHGFYRAIGICEHNFGTAEPGYYCIDRWYVDTSGMSFINGKWLYHNVFVHFDKQDDFVLFSMLYTPE